MDAMQLLEMILEVKHELTKIKIEHEITSKERDTAQDQEDLLRKQYEAARAKRADLAGRADSLRVKSLKAADQLTDLERQLRVAMAEEQRAKALKEKTARFDLITAGAHWRERAMDHQINGAKFLAASEKSICGDERGLGKTCTIIAACDMVEAKRICFITVNDVTDNVVREFARWAPHRKAVYDISNMPPGAREVILPTLKDLTTFVVVINYEALRNDSVLEHLQAMRFDTVIADEAHTMKETTKSAFQAVKRLCWDINVCPSCIESSKFAYTTDKRNDMMCRGCAAHIKLNDLENVSRYRSVKHIWPMTGTPILNRPQEMYALLALTVPELFPALSKFMHDYCEKDWSGKYWTFRKGGESALLSKISAFFLKRTRKSAGVEIPPMEEITYDIVFDKVKYAEQWKAYQDLCNAAYIKMENDKSMTAMAAITQILRLRQMVVYPQGIELRDPETNQVISRCNVTQSIKIDWTLDKITEILDEDPEAHIVIFSQFKPPLHRLKSLLGDKAVVLDGTTKDDVRKKISLHFDASQPVQDAKWRIVLANYKVGGVGLNFTRANWEIDLDQEWNPGKDDQAHGRIDRIGQTKRTFVLVPRVKGTVDIWMHRLIKFKKDMLSGFDTEALNLTDSFIKAMENGFEGED